MGRYHGGRRPSSDDSFHSPTAIPPSALGKPSIMKRYHRRWTTRWGVTARSPTMITLHDTRFVECRWWNDGWTVQTVVTWRSSASMIPAPEHHSLDCMKERGWEKGSGRGWSVARATMMRTLLRGGAGVWGSLSQCCEDIWNGNGNWQFWVLVESLAYTRQLCTVCKALCFPFSAMLAWQLWGFWQRPTVCYWWVWGQQV